LEAEIGKIGGGNRKNWGKNRENWRWKTKGKITKKRN